jgi:hypothetical protein
MFILSCVEYLLNNTGKDQLCYYHRLGVADLDSGLLARRVVACVRVI